MKNRNLIRIMHLTTHHELPHTALIPSGIGAPEPIEIEITSAMIDAASNITVGCDDLIDEKADAYRRIFVAMIRAIRAD